MTREDAIKILKWQADGYYPKTTEALEMVIKALEQELCEDAISREAVLDLCDSKDAEYKVYHFKEDVECLPSVYPKPKTGHWIIEKWNNKEHYSCSSCQHVVDYEPCYYYCPYCGAEMIEPQESEE